MFFKIHQTPTLTQLLEIARDLTFQIDVIPVTIETGTVLEDGHAPNFIATVITARLTNSSLYDDLLKIYGSEKKAELWWFVFKRVYDIVLEMRELRAQANAEVDNSEKEKPEPKQ
jgi:hypothetical protein